MYRQTTPVSRTIYYVSDPSGRLLALTDGTTVYYYGLDGHGSVANLTDKNGAVVNTYRYDPYGNSLDVTETASLPNPWRYAGGYYDAESGLYLLGARYYAPMLGRFLQQDPLGVDALSQYAYAGSDPCNNSDPSGLLTCYRHVGPQDTIRESDILSGESNKEAHDAGTSGGAGIVGGLLGSPAGAAAGAIIAIIQANVASDEATAAAFLANHSSGTWVEYSVETLWHGSHQLHSFCASGDSTSHGGAVMSGSAADGYWDFFHKPDLRETHSW